MRNRTVYSRRSITPCRRAQILLLTIANATEEQSRRCRTGCISIRTISSGMEQHPLTIGPLHDGAPGSRNEAKCHHPVGVGPKAGVQSARGAANSLDSTGSHQRANVEAARRDFLDLIQPMRSAPSPSATRLIGAVDQTLAPCQYSPANSSGRSLQNSAFAALSIPQRRRTQRPAVLVDSTDQPAIHKHFPNWPTAWNHLPPWQSTATGQRSMRHGSACSIAFFRSDDARTGARVLQLLTQSVDHDSTCDLTNHSDTLTAVGPRQTDTESHGRVKGGRNRTRT
jgi:hypothetical protein